MTPGVGRRPRPRLDAVLAVRRAVRVFLAEPDVTEHLGSGELFVAVSGGADSLALAEAAAHVGGRRDLRVCALVVDHRLQPGSDEVAERAAEEALRLGAHAAKVLPVTVTGPGGPEAAARKARYAALREHVGEGSLVLLGHTLDDQAETVLLGLGRGSGARSLAGMRPLEVPWARPLLSTPRAVTRAACDELGVRPWEDPHNADPRFRRVRVRREVLPCWRTCSPAGWPRRSPGRRGSCGRTATPSTRSRRMCTIGRTRGRPSASTSWNGRRRRCGEGC